MGGKWLQSVSQVKSISRGGIALFTALCITSLTFGEGLVTNRNQSSVWVRLPARNASIGIDAVYYNPAGIMKLKNGFHFSVSNQSIFQKREIENSYAGPGGAFGLNEHIYKGAGAAFVVPSVYAVYKMDKIAFSFGFNQIGGSGSTVYKKGLPSFEINQSDLVPLLAASRGASGYRLDSYFKGTAEIQGFQIGAAWKITNWLALSGGIRFVYSSNIYEGHVTDLLLNLTDGWTRADELLKQIANDANASAAVTTAFIGYGLGSLTFAEVPAYYLSATDRTKFEGALAAAGYPSTTKIESADQIFKRTAINFGTRAILFEDQTIDAEQKGSGITPFFSADLSLSKDLNIGIKYEMATRIEIMNKTRIDLLTGYDPEGTMFTMFPNGAKTRNDIPAMLSIGADYRISDNLKVSVGSDYFFDRTADYGHKIDIDLNSATPSIYFENKDIIDKNGISLQAGLEYNVSAKLLVSGGYVWANKGVNAKYQSDLTYGLATQTFGLGGAYNVTDKIQINLGGGYTMYKDDTKVVDHIFSGTGANIQANETYRKSTMMVAVGVDIRF